MTVVPRWNSDEVRCELIVNEAHKELWEISQMALHRFFFGTIGD